MSHVTDCILLYGLIQAREARAAMLADVNAFFGEDGPGMTDARGPNDRKDWIGGTKVFQADMAAGAFHCLNLPRFVAHLRAINWAKYDTHFVQFVWQDEHNNGFAIVDIYHEEWCVPASPEALDPSHDWEAAP